MKHYSLKYKKHADWFWTKKSRIVAQSYQAETNKLVLEFLDGSMEEVANYTDLNFYLGKDFIAFQNSRLKEEKQRKEEKNNGNLRAI